MKKFIIISMVSTAALGLTACGPTAEEAVTPEVVATEAPAETMELMAGDVPVDGMEEDSMGGAEVPEDDGRGNPVDRSPAAN